MTECVREEVVDPGWIAITLLLHGSSNIADASMKTNHRVLPGFPGMGTGPAAQEIVGPNLTVGWQTLLNQCDEMCVLRGRDGTAELFVRLHKVDHRHHCRALD
jgi:hypothetical protein